TVSASTPDSVTLTATGFAVASTVEFTVSVGTCAGRSSVLASTDTLVARFVTTPACTGPANATATAGTQAAGVAFAFDTPVGGASPAGAASAGAAPNGAAPNGAAPAGAAPGGAPAGAPAAAQAPGRRPVASACTVRASGDNVPAVKPGDTVC